jgi:hypothetical protein
MVFNIWKNLGNQVKVNSLVYSSRSYNVLNAYNGLGLGHIYAAL